MPYTITFTSLAGTHGAPLAEAVQNQHGEIKFRASAQEGESGVEMLRLFGERRG